MTHPRPYRPFSTCPHTYGVRPWSSSAIATKPCRPTACVRERPCSPNGEGASALILNSSFYILHWTFTFSAKEKDSETGLSYFGSRYYSSDLSIWLSVDPMAAKYPHQSNYVYCGNNPINLVDPNGMWDVEINENGSSVMFRAEEGDNLQTLATQLGVSLTDLSDYEGTTFEAGQLYSLDKIKKVKAINSAIALMNNEDYNCANFAMFSNGFLLDPAYVNNDGTSTLDQAALMLGSFFNNVSESNSSIGDIVTFGYTEWALRRENNFQDAAELYTPKYTDVPAHYGVVLLKSKDGMSVQSILEKPGQHSVRVSNYQNYNNDFFTPRPKTNDTTPFYRLN